MDKPGTQLQKKYTIKIDNTDSDYSTEGENPENLPETPKNAEMLLVNTSRHHRKNISPTNLLISSIEKMQKNLDTISEAVDVQAKSLSAHDVENFQDFEKRLESKLAEAIKKKHRKETKQNEHERCFIF